MQRHKSKLIELRPDIKYKEAQESLVLEKFQNEVLRSIIKFQHNVIILFANNDKHFPKMNSSKPDEENFNTIRAYFEKNKPLKNMIIGIVVGLLTDDEIMVYFDHTKELNKRISSMIVQRVFDTFKA